MSNTFLQGVEKISRGLLPPAHPWLRAWLSELWKTS